MYKFVAKPKRLRMDISEWSKTSFGNIGPQITNIRVRLIELQEIIDISPGDPTTALEEAQLTSQLSILLAREESKVKETSLEGHYKLEGPKSLKYQVELEDFEDMIVFALTIGTREIDSFEDALSDKQNDKWMTVMIEEMESLKKKQDLRVCQEAQGKESDWVQAITALAAMFDLELEQLDMKTTFLHGDLEEQIFMEKSEGFRVHEKDDHFMNAYDITSLKFMFSYEFDMKDLRAANRIFNTEIHRDRSASKLWVTQKRISERDVRSRNYIQQEEKVYITGGLILWKALFQPTIALSTTEGEYMAAIEAAKEAIWPIGLAHELGVEQEGTVQHCDSQSVINLAKNQVFHTRTKHIDMRYHNIIELVSEGIIHLKKFHTNDNPTYILKKPVTTKKFKLCLDLLNVTHCCECGTHPLEDGVQSRTFMEDMRMKTSSGYLQGGSTKFKSRWILLRIHVLYFKEKYLPKVESKR
ncbi:uncharacterized protein LOC110007208 [Amborella trichopoda]|uniref:uncharacterized protein LOC110007208 n=1 Tax=Amborella trichopoda TaxID=13333 RepID=UPI0009BDEA2F|nr:uncharacterized protein LOC110007208 [Amborella trichopoda]|eukprot:XP_020522568.1 uncharacterized protein LOC110007208 [Amborella trichopoda]